MAVDAEIVEAKEQQSEDIEMLQKALTEQKQRSERYLVNWQRSQADLENYVRRADREKSEIVECANRLLVLDLLSILDDFERALAAVPVELAENEWTKGIKLIYNKLRSLLETQGLAEIKAKGECFDPCVHEAAGQMEGEEGVVIEEIRKGYNFKDKLLRPSMVMVGKDSKHQTRQESREEE